MSFIPSDQPLRWLVGKQDMISRKQVSVSVKSPTHSPNSGDARLSRFLGSGRMTGNPHLTRRWPFGRVTEGLPTTRESNMTSHRSTGEVRIGNSKNFRLTLCNGVAEISRSTRFWLADRLCWVAQPVFNRLHRSLRRPIQACQPRHLPASNILSLSRWRTAALTTFWAGCLTRRAYKQCRTSPTRAAHRIRSTLSPATSQAAHSPIPITPTMDRASPTTAA